RHLRDDRRDDTERRIRRRRVLPGGLMTIIRVGAAKDSQNAAALALAWATAGGGSAPQADDFALLAWNGMVGLTWTDPAGFTLLRNVDAPTGSHRGRLYYRVCDGSESGDVALTHSAINKQTAILELYRGVDPAAPVSDFESFIETVTQTSHACPQVTTGSVDEAVVTFIQERVTDSSTNYTAPSGYTKRDQPAPAGGGGSTSAAAADDGLAVSRAAGTDVTPPNWTNGVSTANVITWSVALKQAVSDINALAGRVTGTGTARPVTAAKNTAVGRATGTGTARPVTTVQQHVAGRVTATGTARPVSVSTEGSGMALFPALSIQAAFTVGASTGTLLHLDDPTRGLLDTGTLGDGSQEEPTWVELADRAVEGQGSIVRGSQRVDSPIVQYDPGTLSIPLANHDRHLDPANLDGPYVDPGTGKTRVTAMRAVRVRATWANVTYELFQGTADGWDVTYQDPGQSVTALTATDGMKVLAGNSRPAVAAVGDGEDTGARVNRILDAAGWNTEDRLVDEGDTFVQPTTLDGEVLAQLQLVADSEIGELYVDGGGRVRFRARNALLTDTRSNTSQAIFGDAGDELPYKDLAISTDDATFFNQVRVTRAARETAEGDPPDVPVEQTADDTASQALFYAKTFVPSTAPILRTDADTAAYAQWLLAVASEPELRFTELTFEPAVQPADLWPQALGREIGDRITIIRRPPGGGSPIEMDCFIRGITHEFGGESWVTKWVLQSAERYGGFLVLDDVLLGRLDGNRLAY
ncbi:MAG TPA: hypothetical protein VIS06_13715, partial [Mycobacteriales bacterium]